MIAEWLIKLFIIKNYNIDRTHVLSEFITQIGPCARSDCSKPMFYQSLYNNQLNARALIGQSAMGYCAGKPMGKSRGFWVII